MKLIFLNHHNETKKEIEATPENLSQLEQEYGMNGFFSEYEDLKQGLQDFADYLSNHHMDVVVSDDEEMQKSENNNKPNYGKVFTSGKDYIASKQGQQTKATLFPKPRTAPAGQLPNYGKVIQPKPMGKDEDRLSNLLTKGHARTLEKMSRPRVSFPKLGLDTRPDQNVQVIETGRQKDLFGRKVANQGLREYQEKTGKKLEPKAFQFNADKNAKAISGKFDTKVLGLNYGLKDKSISGALAGKARSKFEEGDEEHKAKLAERSDKFNEAKLKYNEDMAKWRKEAEQFPSGSTAYWSHIASRPKPPKVPRRPAKRAVATSQLSPEKMAARGRAVDTTIEHEALHNLMDQVQKKFGSSGYTKVRDGLLSHYKPESLNAVANFIEEARGYKRGSDGFKEEVLTHARDLLVDPKKRDDFKRYLQAKSVPGKESAFDQHIKDLKQGHQKAYQWAKNLTPEHISSAISEDNNARVAAEKV